ncbi:MULTISPECIES: hypothetical protein [unclassified Gordonia (in: high G+C Gram-positive bacteria)]|uniref:hypothetical protein n=1 Tax=unclassified Gordonia (in: high G+C Gram-positive bacteria) TaxID=2657482 RepID=UPI0009910DF4|nr:MULTISPECIES: hypothetical protein [unclassified Gordonia (in: high G+C Gram-positive bacteria)]MCT1354322.1 hypothetical protein [Gordonia sp. p3-SID1431]MCX2754480.1 hypothetical protein [Gordonia sp. 4N]
MIALAADPGVHHLATHPLVLALPAVIPAFLVVGVIVAIAIIDRRRGDDEDDEGDADDAAGRPGEAGRTAAEPAGGDPDPTDPPTRNEADDPAREAD